MAEPAAPLITVAAPPKPVKESSRLPHASPSFGIYQSRVEPEGHVLNVRASFQQQTVAEPASAPLTAVAAPPKPVKESSRLPHASPSIGIYQSGVEPEGHVLSGIHGRGVLGIAASTTITRNGAASAVLGTSEECTEVGLGQARPPIASAGVFIEGAGGPVEPVAAQSSVLRWKEDVEKVRMPASRAAISLGSTIPHEAAAVERPRLPPQRRSPPPKPSLSSATPKQHHCPPRRPPSPRKLTPREPLEGYQALIEPASPRPHVSLMITSPGPHNAITAWQACDLSARATPTSPLGRCVSSRLRGYAIKRGIRCAW